MTLTDTFKTCLGIKKDETILLLTDSEMTGVSEIISRAVKPLTNELITMSIHPRGVHGEELPHTAGAAMAKSDVVIGATSKSMTHTEATKNAVKQGARVASMPGITVQILNNGGMTADYHVVAGMARKVAGVLTHGKTIEIKTSVGTDFKADISGRTGYADTGLLVNKGDFGNLPGGEGFIAPLEKGSAGRIIFDGPIASSGVSHKPISVDVESGDVVSTDYEVLKKIFKDVDGASGVGEIGLGVNPKAKLTGNILEDEKALGTAHIAFGNNLNFGGTIRAKIHIDGIIKKPTILVDGELVVREGSLLV